jgi:hypothetical protein
MLSKLCPRGASAKRAGGRGPGGAGAGTSPSPRDPRSVAALGAKQRSSLSGSTSRRRETEIWPGDYDGPKVEAEPKSFLKPRRSSPVYLLLTDYDPAEANVRDQAKENGYDTANGNGYDQAGENGHAENGHAEIKGADPLRGTVRYFVQGELSPQVHLYQTRLLRDARAFRAQGCDAVGEQWEAKLGDSCKMSVKFSFIGSGSDILVEIGLTNFVADTLKLLGLSHYPELWPKLSIGRTVEKVNNFSPNDFFIALRSSLPLPMIPGFHNVVQFVKYDLLDEEERGLLFAIETPSKDATSWRNSQIPPLKKGCVRIDMDLITILLVPTGGVAGRNGRNEVAHDIKIKAAMDLKIPRWVLTGRVAKWLVNTLGRSVYGYVMNILRDWESTDFAERAAYDKEYFEKLSTRIAEFLSRLPARAA